MRRSDREIREAERIDAIISSCHCCRLGFCDGKDAYIVPLNFGFCSEGGKRAFYFHSAKEGRKIELIARNGHAGFELDTGYALKTGETACSHSARFQSVIGSGTVSFVEEAAEKKTALRLLMEHNTGRADWKFTSALPGGGKIRSACSGWTWKRFHVRSICRIEEAFRGPVLVMNMPKQR